MSHVLPLMLVLSLIFLYPALFAAVAPLFGVICLLVGMFLIMLTRSWIVKNEIFLILVLWFAVFSLSSILNLGSNYSSLIIFLIPAIFFSILAMSTLSNTSHLSAVNFILIIILSVQGFSCFVTFMLIINGIPRENLLIVDWLPNERIPVNAYIPFSFGGTNMFTMESGSFMRFSGFFREPGVTQIFYIYFCTASIIFLQHWKKLAVSSMIMGLIASFSTTALVTFPAMLLGILILKTKNVFFRIVYIFFVPMVGFILYLTPYIGLKDKMDSHTHSIETRLQGYQYLLQSLNETFGFGEGIFSPGPVVNSSINFILSLRENGIFGIALFALFFIIPLIILPRGGKFLYFVLTSPFLLTVSFAQPIFYSVMTIFIFVNSYMLSKRYADGEKL